MAFLNNIVVLCLLATVFGGFVGTMSYRLLIRKIGMHVVPALIIMLVFVSFSWMLISKALVIVSGAT